MLQPNQLYRGRPAQSHLNLASLLVPWSLTCLLVPRDFLYTISLLFANVSTALDILGNWDPQIIAAFDHKLLSHEYSLTSELLTLVITNTKPNQHFTCAPWMSWGTVFPHCTPLFSWSNPPTGAAHRCGPANAVEGTALLTPLAWAVTISFQMGQNSLNNFSTRNSMKMGK